MVGGQRKETGKGDEDGMQRGGGKEKARQSPLFLIGPAPRSQAKGNEGNRPLPSPIQQSIYNTDGKKKAFFFPGCPKPIPHPPSFLTAGGIGCTYLKKPLPVPAGMEGGRDGYLSVLPVFSPILHFLHLLHSRLRSKPGAWPWPTLAFHPTLISGWRGWHDEYWPQSWSLFRLLLDFFYSGQC